MSYNPLCKFKISAVTIKFSIIIQWHASEENPDANLQEKWGENDWIFIAKYQNHLNSVNIKQSLHINLRHESIGFATQTKTNAKLWTFKDKKLFCK